MNAQEELWFQLPTWNHDRGTTNVAILFQQKTPLKIVFPMVKSYFKSIGFSMKNPNVTPTNFSVILVDLVDKKIDVVSHTEYRLAERDGIETAVPSQVLAYVQNNKGMLTGKKFGL
jgi:hypothetical protein